jgi:hypothetical protein
MSTELREAAEESESYVQSPIDDMSSFYWTAVWAILYNQKCRGETDEEIGWREEIRGKSASRGEAASEMQSELTEYTTTYSPMLRRMVPVLNDWWDKLDRMRDDWDRLWEVQKMKNSEPDIKSVLFHRFAYQGVYELVKVISSRKEYLQQPMS